MKLADWIEAKGIKRKDVAEFLGVTPQYVTNLCSKEPSWPSRDVMAKLGELTAGMVSASDFLPVRAEIYSAAKRRAVA
jgi:transcriptional regulator with XRE-family HTH domain